MLEITLQIADYPPKPYRVMVARIFEYIIGIDVIRGMDLWIDNTLWSFGSTRWRFRAIQVGKIQEEANIPICTQIVNLKQYKIPGGDEEIQTTIQELLEAQVVRYTHSPFNSPIWPVRKSDGSWRMTVDYRGVNKVTPPITSAVPAVTDLVHEIQKHPGDWYAVIDVANAFFTIPIPQAAQDQFAFTWKGIQYTFTRLPQGYKHSPTYCHQAIHRTLKQLPNLNPSVQIVQYVDDILIHGNTEHETGEVLEKVVDTLKKDGWAVNPKKIQGPATSVKYLGITWHAGKQEVPEQIRQAIKEWPTPTTKRETQQFLGAVGFWRSYLPGLAILLKPLHRVTRKKAVFEWGSEQQTAFEGAKNLIQEYMELHPIQAGPIELQVSVEQDVALWSLWQLQDGRRRPLGFWSRRFRGAEEKYTPFEKQLAAVYWGLLDTEDRTAGHEVIVRTPSPVVSWALGPTATNKIGSAQEQTIVKMRWYIQERAKAGTRNLHTLHEQVSSSVEDTSLQEKEKQLMQNIQLGRWGVPYENLSDEQKRNAWFTDGGGTHQGKWTAVAINPVTGTRLVTTGESGSSQLAELVAVWQALEATPPNTICYVYTDSWAVAQGLVHWLPIWKKAQWKIGSKIVWGQQWWEKIYALLQSRDVWVYHVDAHTTNTTPTHIGNQLADKLTKQVRTVNSSEETALALWAHEKAGHGGRDATIYWGKQRGVHLSATIVSDVIQKCSVCQTIKQQALKVIPLGSLKKGMNSAEIWQLDFIGPLPEHRRQRYVCTAVDTYSGVLVAIPSRYANAFTTVRMLDTIETYYGTPVEIQTDNGSHFKNHLVQKWADERQVHWVWHLPYHPQGAGLIERMNGLLKQQLKRLGEGKFTRWVDHITEAVRVLNNRALTPTTTPLLLMKRETPTVCKVNINAKVSYQAGDQYGIVGGATVLELSNKTSHSYGPQEVKWERPDCQLKAPSVPLVKLLALAPRAVTKGLTLLNPVQEGHKPVLLGIKNTANHTVVLHPGPLCSLVYVASIPPTPSVAVGGIGHRVWYTPPGQSPVAAEIIATDQSHAVTIAVPGNSEWLRVPLEQLRRRD
ncbi:PREDICTED: endogenous retrovirus group K member 8 Pol protein-like [Lepidothrix coronata]|uniref:ribonuclease H n=1 Tax=Lepidothrix coronata TaxID=321398 RepID=A0A6J0J8H6_9PASS|nr:PREDICTED: endogenous retrovirus group K member 8 Pol protein-like [Lepidothrix coronata]